MNLTSLIQETSRLLGDPTNNRWTTDVLTARINIVQTEIQGLTNAVKTSEAITPTAGVSQIMVQANTMDIIRVTKTLSDRFTVWPLRGISREELDFQYPDWQNWDDGEPLLWFWDATNLQLNLLPAPSSQYAFSSAIHIWESRKPADLALSTDVPFDSNNQMIPYHMAIVHGVVALCFQDDGTPEAFAKSKFHKSGVMLHPGEYEKWVGKIMAEFDSPDKVPSRIMFQPQGGRTGGLNMPSKSSPFLW